MIGIVVVSHSAKLAEGVVDLAREMGGKELGIKAVGGLNTPDHELGTDPTMIAKAIDEVFSPDGVLVLMDLGSALLSAEMAIEMLPAEQAQKVYLCAAPIVEGTVAAAVQARLGTPIQQVIQEAKGSLQAKETHFGIDAADIEAPIRQLSGETIDLHIKVNNPLGLHARPAARFVQTAGIFPETNIQVTNQSSGRGPVNAKSINAVTTLGVRCGDEILITACGSEAREALQAFQDLAHENFGDEQHVSTKNPGQIIPSIKPEQEAIAGCIQGIPVSTGIAIGPVLHFKPQTPEIPQKPAENPQQEWDELQKSIKVTRKQIQENFDSASQRMDKYTAAIFEAHLLFLEDEALLNPAHTAIFQKNLNAGAAWMLAVEQIAAEYRGLDDEYLQGRARDVEDVGKQVLINLLGMQCSRPEITSPCILAANDLTPSETTNLDPAMVKGILTAFGGPTSHAAILARGLGIPAIAGLGESISEFPNEILLVMDGATGQVWIDPDDELVDQYTAMVKTAEDEKALALSMSKEPAVTIDGHQIEIAANIGSANDAKKAATSGAEGVGLFRTEFLFLDRQDPPDEDEQYKAYREAAQALEGKPLIIRTLDAGGDKPIPYLNLTQEANPFLGLRAIRVCLKNPEIFKTQLRAVVRVAAEFPVKIMFPMIATLAEWREAQASLEDAIQEVKNNLQSIPQSIKTGMMVEVPAAALQAESFAEEVDFFSIGTNDLTQYVFAAERGNSAVQGLADAMHPAILKLIHKVVEAAHSRGKWVGVCGELAGNPEAIPVLAGLGVDELSMSPPAIPIAKQIIRRLEFKQIEKLALAAISQTTADDVRKLFLQHLELSQ